MFVYQAHKTKTMVVALVFSLRITVVNRKGVLVEKWHRGEQGRDKRRKLMTQELAFYYYNLCLFLDRKLSVAVVG